MKGKLPTIGQKEKADALMFKIHRLSGLSSDRVRRGLFSQPRPSEPEGHA